MIEKPKVLAVENVQDIIIGGCGNGGGHGDCGDDGSGGVLVFVVMVFWW